MVSRFVRFKARLHALLSEDSGQGIIEYLLLLALMGFLVVAASAAFSSAVNSSVNSVSTHFNEHMNHGKHKGED